MMSIKPLSLMNVGIGSCVPPQPLNSTRLHKQPSPNAGASSCQTRRDREFQPSPQQAQAGGRCCDPRHSSS